MIMIEFRDVQADELVGTVAVGPNGLRPRGLGGLVYTRGWKGTTDEFLAKYRDWSNGYTTSRVIERERDA